jgi:alkanesulfonate monooxygenase SsuD/methylene tetrahydromethanopterin reductase-like flavin-dependent oxidoreductase (luciferase family)
MEPAEAVELGHLAEERGWDGVFMAEPVWGTDPWATLCAISMATSRIRLGTMLTPPSRRRPWTLASQVATLDRLSGGRAILSVGLGALDSGFESFGEVTDRRTRAELVDESLDVITGLWSGEPFLFDGRHYHVSESTFLAGLPPVQRPRVPIWVVAAWGRRPSMARALRYDGILPCVVQGGQVRTLTPDELRALRGEIEAQRGTLDGFDLVVEGTTAADDPAGAREAVSSWSDAGATWWIESNWEPYGREGGAAILRERIEAGPPVPLGSGN